MTADWRQKTSVEEDAVSFLKRLQLNTLQHKKRQADYKVIPSEIEKLPQLPAGWLWVTLESVASHLSGSAFRSADFQKEGIQVIRLGNLYKGVLDLTRDPVFLPESFCNSNYVLKPEDILISQTGTRFKRDYGNFTLLPKTAPKLLLNQRVMAVFCHQGLPAEYIVFVSKLPHFREHFFSHETGGVNQGNVGVSGVMKGPIPLAPKAEIEIIMYRLRRLLTLANTLEGLARNSSNELSRLHQAILAKAFVGELVPQDPNDKPASVLLERIQEERRKAEAAGGKKSGGKRRGRGQSGEQLSFAPETADGP